MTQTVPRTAAVPSVDAIVDAQIRCARQLCGLLGEEHRALLDNNLEQLAEIGAAKLQAARQLEALGAQLQVHPPTAAGAPASAPWQQLTELARECRDQNRANGALLDARASQVRHGLQALQGNVAPTYGRAGETPAGFARRINGRV
jgi:flagellar biosynthesis/type III secretory pathway chaperone